MSSTLKPIIVVVDQDEEYLLAVKKFVELEMISHTVLVVSNPIEAIRVMHTLPGPAIFMVGSNVDDMTANKLIRHIKKTFRFPEFCFLLVENEHQEVMASALNEGALPFRKARSVNGNEYNFGILFKAYIEYAEAKLNEPSTDSLTGLYTRKSGMSMWSRDYIRAKRTRKTTCLIYCDLDSLKYVNDTYGHEKGDLMIKAVANSILQDVRTSYDYGIRIGGDEFIIVMPETNQTSALGVKKRLEDHIKSLLIDVGCGPKGISVSMGLSVLPPSALIKDSVEAFNTLVMRAEKKMYIQKKAHKKAFASEVKNI